MCKVLESVSFNAHRIAKEEDPTVRIDADYVKRHSGDLDTITDVQKYIL